MGTQWGCAHRPRRTAQPWPLENASGQLRKEPGWSQAELGERIGADAGRSAQVRDRPHGPRCDALVPPRRGPRTSRCDYLLIDVVPRRPLHSAEDALGDRLADVAELERRGPEPGRQLHRRPRRQDPHEGPQRQHLNHRARRWLTSWAPARLRARSRTRPGRRRGCSRRTGSAPRRGGAPGPGPSPAPGKGRGQPPSGPGPSARRCRRFSTSMAPSRPSAPGCAANHLARTVSFLGQRAELVIGSPQGLGEPALLRAEQLGHLVGRGLLFARGGLGPAPSVPPCPPRPLLVLCRAARSCNGAGGREPSSWAARPSSPATPAPATLGPQDLQLPGSNVAVVAGLAQPCRNVGRDSGGQHGPLCHQGLSPQRGRRFDVGARCAGVDGPPPAPLLAQARARSSLAWSASSAAT